MILDRLDDGVNMPRASLLSYFRIPHHNSTSIPLHSARKNCDSEQGILLPYTHTDFRPISSSTSSSATRDDASKVYADCFDADEEDEDASWGWRDVLSSMIWALFILAVVRNADILFSRLGLENAGWGWISRGTKVVVSDTHMGMMKTHFCLEAHASENPGPRTWRIIVHDKLDECRTVVVILVGRQEDVWKMMPGDEIVVEDTRPKNGHAQDWGKFLDNKGEEKETLKGEEEEHALDDLAEEGKLGRPPVNIVHAGFGGPWH